MGRQRARSARSASREAHARARRPTGWATVTPSASRWECGSCTTGGPGATYPRRWTRATDRPEGKALICVCNVHRVARGESGKRTVTEPQPIRWRAQELDRVAPKRLVLIAEAERRQQLQRSRRGVINAGAFLQVRGPGEYRQAIDVSAAASPDSSGDFFRSRAQPFLFRRIRSGPGQVGCSTTVRSPSPPSSTS